jgi:hypothetical protein
MQLTIEYVDSRDVLVLVGMSMDGDVLSSAECRAMLDCPASAYRKFVAAPFEIRRTLDRWKDELKETHVKACQVLTRECLETKRLELIQWEDSPLASDRVKRRAAEAKLAIHQYKSLHRLSDEAAEHELRRLEEDLERASEADQSTLPNTSKGFA